MRLWNNKDVMELCSLAKDVCMSQKRMTKKIWSLWETLQEYWWCTERSLDWGPGGGPDLIVDDGGNATMLIHEGVKAEEEFAKSGKLPDPTSTDNAEFHIVLSIIKEEETIAGKDEVAGISPEKMKWSDYRLS
ncbi:hypothetical protein LXL04_039749 [Taraxacum kok-saghyz]